MPPRDATAWWALARDDVLARLGTHRDGLSAAEARARRRVHGPNRLRAGDRTGPWTLLLHQFASPLVYVLLAAMVLSLGMAWFEGTASHLYDAIVIALVLVLNAALGFFQEHRAEGAISALLELVAPRATVLRDGRRTEIASERLVPGDVVLLESGDLVPADLRLLETVRLESDESSVTGESLPVAKDAAPLPGDGTVPLAERRNMAFMGTTVSKGRGRGVVIATAHGTEIGAIATEIRAARRVKTPLQRRVDRFGRWIALAIVVASALAFAIGWLRGEDLGAMFLTAVAIAVAAMPEGLPVVMTITLAVSVRRMARRHAVVRRLPAVETLGSCTVIVTDKTGTLTRNQMTVQQVVAGGRRFEVTGIGLAPAGRILRDGMPVDVATDPPLHRVLVAGVLCNESELQGTGDDPVPRGDPTEIALLVLGRKGGIEREALLEEQPRTDAIPFESENRYAASVHRHGDGDILYLVGAPERVADMCDRQLGPAGETGPFDRETMLGTAAELADEGLRVLALASGDEGSTARQPGALVYAGLVGMLDPPREDAAAAVAACTRAGMRVIMVTGDHQRTAAAIARRVGLTQDGDVVDGRALAEMTDERLDRELARVRVFARASAADKLRIVERLEQAGEIVAVTGDGVNDAPALERAHVGAAMGRSGTAVAVEASEIV